MEAKKAVKREVDIVPVALLRSVEVRRKRVDNKRAKLRQAAAAEYQRRHERLVESIHKLSDVDRGAKVFYALGGTLLASTVAKAFHQMKECDRAGDEKGMLAMAHELQENKGSRVIEPSNICVDPLDFTQVARLGASGETKPQVIEGDDVAVLRTMNSQGAEEYMVFSKLTEQEVYDSLRWNLRDNDWGKLKPGVIDTLNRLNAQYDLTHKPLYASVAYMKVDFETAAFDELAAEKDYVNMLRLAAEYDYGDAPFLEYTYRKACSHPGDVLIAESEHYAVVRNSISGTYDIMRKVSERGVQNQIKWGGLPDGATDDVRKIAAEMVSAELGYRFGGDEWSKKTVQGLTITNRYDRDKHVFYSQVSDSLAPAQVTGITPYDYNMTLGMNLAALTRTNMELLAGADFHHKQVLGETERSVGQLKPEGEGLRSGVGVEERGEEEPEEVLDEVAEEHRVIGRGR